MSNVCDQTQKRNALALFLKSLSTYVDLSDFKKERNLSVISERRIVNADGKQSARWTDCILWANSLDLWLGSKEKEKEVTTRLKN